MADVSERRDSNTELLHELEALSETLYQSHTARRTASLVLPRSATPAKAAPLPLGHSDHHQPLEETRSEHRPRSRRMSMSPWRSRPSSKQDHSDGHGDNEDDDEHNHHSRHRHSRQSSTTHSAVEAVVEEKKGIWNWKPMRALSHIAMHRMGCLFSVDVVAIQGLPASMNGLRLSVSIRKKESKDGTVQTMPARVLQGAADFEETMFIRCHVYCTGGAGTGKPIKFEPRPFVISAIAIDAPELDFGKNTVDLSSLMKDSMEKSLEGARIRNWDQTFKLAGKAKGGELVLKLGFQIMEDGGVGIYAQPETKKTPSSSRGTGSPSSFARKQSKSSFSISSPRTPGRTESVTTTSKSATTGVDFKEIDDFRLDEPAPPPPPRVQTEVKMEDLDMPEFEVVDKGIEVEEEKKHEKEIPGEEEEEEEARSVSSEVVVKEVVVQDPVHQMRLTELDSIAMQIKALESMMTGDRDDVAKTAVPEAESNELDANEETVTREFLQMLELEDDGDFKLDTQHLAAPVKSMGDEEDEGETKVFVSDLGRGLGSVVQTKDGGYLAAANPFDVEVRKKETPKLAMQISKPVILKDQKSATGFELFQRMAVMGSKGLESKLLSMTAMDELLGKTAEQIAFEGIAAAIISGRNKEGASSSAARLVTALKTMSSAMGAGRKERISTGLWNAGEEPVSVDELLAFSLQRIESMVIEALKIQADMSEEEAPFDVFPLAGKDDPNPPLSSATPIDDWKKKTNRSPIPSDLTLLVVVQLRDPVRRYETVGAPVIAMVQGVGVGRKGDDEMYKVGSVHVGGLRAGKRELNSLTLDGEKQRLTAMQWLVAYGLGKAGKKAKAATATTAGAVRGGNDLLWSLSSRIMAEMWLKPLRNPDVKLPN